MIHSAAIADILHDVATRRAAGGRTPYGKVVFRLTAAGSAAVRFERMRSIVQEDDRVKLYGTGVILPDDLITSVTPLASGSGRVHGVRIETLAGVLTMTAPPFLRKPTRKARLRRPVGARKAA